MPNDKDRAKVTLDNDVTPGYYQGLKGLKTGREAPRTPVRGTRRAAILAEHGMIDQGAADPNHGQLFNTRHYEGSRDVTTNAPRPEVNVRPSAGKPVDLPLGAAPGFMPGLDKKQKVRAIQKLGAEMGTDTPMRDAMQKRQEVSDRSAPAPWYSGVNAAGKHDPSIPGDANIAIDRAAQRQGVSSEQMTRTTAVTSPQNRWDTYHPSNQGYVQNNIALAENVTRNTYNLSDPSDDAIQDMGLQSVQESPGGGGTPEMAAKAGRIIRDDGSNVTKPLEVKQKTSQKVPNFEASLHLTNPDPHVRRGAAQSFTVDTHDAKLVGVGEKHMSTVGAYEAIAMTGSRTALRNRELAPNEQARQWVGQRGGTQHNEDEGFFKTDRGKLKVRPEATPGPVTGKGTSRVVNRDRFGEEVF